MDAASLNDQDRLALLRRAVESLEAEHGIRVGRRSGCAMDQHEYFGQSIAYAAQQQRRSAVEQVRPGPEVADARSLV